LGKVSVRITNRKAMESLVRAGALERFGARSVLMHNLDMMLSYANRLQKDALSGQVDLFGMSDEHAHATKPQLNLEKAVTVYNSREQLLWERELLGLYLSQHPLAMFKTYLEEKTIPVNQLK